MRLRAVARCFVGALVTATLLLSAPASAQRRERQLLPVDEAARHAEFFTFRARLQAAIARRDIDTVVSMSSAGIKQSFGGDGGTASWRQALSKNAALLSDLAETLALGGTFTSPDQFVAPYIYSAWPEQLDAFSYVAVVGDRVSVRASSSPQSELVTTLSYALVPVGPRGEQNGMTEVELADGRRGFVATRFLRSSVSYRALFTRTEGRWLLAAFVAGD